MIIVVELQVFVLNFLAFEVVVVGVVGTQL
jgi:hypothetical protein